MSLISTEGFDQYDPGADATTGLTRRYSYGTNGADIVGSASPNLGNVLWLRNVRWLAESYLSARQPASTAKTRSSFWFKLVDAPSSNEPFFFFNTDTRDVPPTAGSNPNSFGLSIGITANNALFATAHGASAILGQTANDVIVTNQWHHLDIEILAANSGTAKIYVDEVLVLDDSDDYLVEAFTLFTGFSFDAGSSGFGFYVDDLIMHSDAGTDFDTYPIGEHEIETLVPTADSSVQFTPLSGDNFENIDDSGKPDDDTTYNESDVTGDIDEFDLANQSTTPLSTIAISLHTVSKKSLSGGATLSQHLVAGESPATDYEGDTHSLTTGYLHYDDYFPNNPSASAPWANTDINDILVGYRKKS